MYNEQWIMDSFLRRREGGEEREEKRGRRREGGEGREECELRYLRSVLWFLLRCCSVLAPLWVRYGRVGG